MSQPLCLSLSPSPLLNFIATLNLHFNLKRLSQFIWNCAITVIDPTNGWASFLVSISFFYFSFWSLSTVPQKPSCLAACSVSVVPKRLSKGWVLRFLFISKFRLVLLKFSTYKRNGFFLLTCFSNILHIISFSLSITFSDIMCVFITVLSLFLPLFYSTVAQNLFLSPSRPIRIKWVLTASPFLTYTFFLITFVTHHTIIWHNLISLVACSALCHSCPTQIVVYKTNDGY